MHDIAAPLPGALAADATEPSILPGEARGLVFAAGGRRLIDGIDLRLERGPLTVIVGPNGAGKSLLLRLLHGLIEPSAGEVVWGDGAKGSNWRRHQAMVFQRPVLLRRSVAANMRYALRAKDQGATPDSGKVGGRIQSWLGRAGLTSLADSPARVLSGGEQQRLALARALSTAPEVLFLDEPTASLDPASVLAIEQLILEARRAGTKIVMVTHDLGQARRLADEMIFLYRGRIEAQAPTARFFEQPDSDKARDFVAGRIVL